VSVPLLRDLPWIGDVLFRQSLIVYVVIALVPVVFYLTRRTWFGLYARAASEYPRAAESAGLSVPWLRSTAVVIGCMLTAVGGAQLFASAGGFVSGYTSGRGFIALAIVVLARWNPFAVLGASLLFGVTQALQFEARNIGLLADVPTSILVALPYVVTIVAVVLARGSRYPAGVGIPFRPARSAA
jgi:general nucleoside transport system permease protein